MKQLINIRLSVKENEFMLCNYLWLDPCAPNTGRKFIFSGIQSGKNIAGHDDTIRVSITVCNKKNEWIFFIEFDIFVLDYDNENLSKDEWWVYGTVCNIEEMEYSQGKVDTFNTWQKQEVFDWFSLPINSPLKLDYLGACMIYSGLSTKMVEKDVYYFDMSLVKEERDFFYLVSLEFVGDRGYFGHDLHTYKDCLLELYNYNGYFYSKKIIFLNSDKIYNQEIEKLFEDIKSEFVKYKFLIEN